MLSEEQYVNTLELLDHQVNKALDYDYDHE